MGVAPFGRGFRPRFGWVFRLVLGVGFACLFGVFWWWGFGCVWVGVVGERERQRRTGKGERVKANGRKGARQTRQTAQARTGARLARFRPSVQSYLFSVDNICRMVGGILQPNGNRKTANSMCPLTLTPTNISPNTEHIRSVGGFGNLPNSGGEFRNRNHGFLL